MGSDRAVRSWFDAARAGFTAVTDGIDDPALDGHGLGEWTVRSLLGHTSRALSTIETYLQAAATAVPGSTPRRLRAPQDYYSAAKAVLADPAQVTERGRAAGLALGPDPRTAAHQFADRVGELVAHTPDSADVLSPVGIMTLIDYLPTRAFELTVHSLDLAAATAQPPTQELLSAVQPALDLCLALTTDDQRTTVLLAVTGRQSLPTGFSCL